MLKLIPKSNMKLDMFLIIFREMQSLQYGCVTVRIKCITEVYTCKDQKINITDTNRKNKRLILWMRNKRM